MCLKIEPIYVFINGIYSVNVYMYLLFDNLKELKKQQMFYVHI